VVRLAIAFILCCSACAPTRSITKPLACARIRYRPRPDAYFLGRQRVTREAFEDELSRFPDAKTAVRRTHAMFAAGATLAIVGATVFFFGLMPSIASHTEHAFEGVAGTAVPLFATGISLLGGSHVELDRAAGHYNAQIGDRCPRSSDEELP
jgi:hypothetical protein